MTTKITEQNISNIANFAVDWQSVVTADGSTNTTAVAGKGYFIDTTSAAHTIVLPSSPNIGDTIIIKDYAETFGSNNITLSRNGSNIGGVAENGTLNINGQVTTLVYVDSTKGWLSVENEAKANVVPPQFISATGGTIITTGDFKVHAFTGDGCFVVSQTGNAPTNPLGGPVVVDYLVVAGGGGGGTSISGGAGAGGFRTSSGAASGCYTTSPLGSGVPGITVSSTTYPITVGGGGAGATPNGVSGSPSTFSTITSAGGGRTSGYNGTGTSGGSGGGGSGGCSGTRPGGAGNTPPVSPPQGNAGGPSTSQDAAGGGGGAAGAGTTGYCYTVGCGGGGSFVSAPFIGPTAPSYGETGPSGRYFSGGGGGGLRNPVASPNPGSGGLGGGGYARASNTGTDGTANTGGGGGGGSYDGTERIGGSGGKGIVIIRYKFQ